MLYSNNVILLLPSPLLSLGLKKKASKRREES